MNDELFARLSSVTCAADIKDIAAELGKELSDADAEAILADVQRANPTEGELSDETLEKVSGGFDWQGLMQAFVDHKMKQ